MIETTGETSTQPLGPGDHEVEAYLRDAGRHRRRSMRRAAAVLAIGAAACGAMVTQMTDMGHATGFGALALGLLFGAFAVAIEGR